MNLTLEVTSPQASALGQDRRKVFGLEGGTIGRMDDNTWVLAESFVSGRHAIIRFVDGSFQIEDTSRNGTFLNAERMVRGQLYPINSGDRITIEPYEIVVHVEQSDLAPPQKQSRSSDPFELITPESDPFLPADPIEGLRLKRDGVAPKGPSPAHLNSIPVPYEHYTPPQVQHNEVREVIPENWDLSSGSIPIPNPLPAAPRQAPKHAKAPAAKAPVSATATPAGGDMLSAFLEAAGIDAASITPDVASDLGEILRVVVSGVMDVLKARQQTKDQFNLGMTTFKPADNNPLKFSADIEEALQRLFVRRANTKYLGPVEAFQDAFEDMRNHQIAMLVGVRVAFEAMLSEFDPDHLQEQFDRTVKKGALVSMPARLRYWELYREWIHDMVRDADTSFRELFGDEFARAYEEQLKKLKAQGRAAKG